MIGIIIDRCSKVNRVMAADITSKSQKTFVVDARAMAVGAMKDVGITDNIIKSQLNASDDELEEMLEMHKCNFKRGGYYMQDYTDLMSFVNQPILNEDDYQSVREIEQKDLINKLELKIKALQTQLNEIRCK